MIEVWHLVVATLSLGVAIVGGFWGAIKYIMAHVQRIDTTINAQVQRRTEMFENLRVAYQTAHEHMAARISETNERIHLLRVENIRDFATRHDIDKMERQVELMNEKMETIVQLVSGMQGGISSMQALLSGKIRGTMPQ